MQVNSSRYNKEQWNKLRTVVKITHMKHYPKEFVNDKEADKILDTISPATLEKLYELAVNHGISEL